MAPIGDALMGTFQWLSLQNMVEDRFPGILPVLICLTVLRNNPR